MNNALLYSTEVTIEFSSESYTAFEGSSVLDITVNLFTLGVIDEPIVVEVSSADVTAVGRYTNE